MDADGLSNMMNALVIGTVVIFAVSLGLFGYSSLKGRLAARR
jgi:hypothetical protein